MHDPILFVTADSHHLALIVECDLRIVRSIMRTNFIVLRKLILLAYTMQFCKITGVVLELHTFVELKIH